MQPSQAINNEQIVAALRPFAEIGAWLFARNLPDETPAVEINGLNGTAGCLTRGDFKAAFNAMRALEGMQEDDDAAHGAPGMPVQEPGHYLLTPQNGGKPYTSTTAPDSWELRKSDISEAAGRCGIPTRGGMSLLTNRVVAALLAAGGTPAVLDKGSSVDKLQLQDWQASVTRRQR